MKVAAVAWLAGCLGTAAAALPEEQTSTHRQGFEVLTRADTATIAEDVAVVRYEGAIDGRMADDLLAIWSEIRGEFRTVVLDLDSPGGNLAHAERAVATLQEIRKEATLKTLVYHGKRCFSACLLLFMQGDERIAGGSSSWMLHGACPPYGNLPMPGPTRRYTELLGQAGVSEDFLAFLDEHGYMRLPGSFWASGYELFHLHRSNVITRLLDAWRPEDLHFESVDPQLAPR